MKAFYVTKYGHPEEVMQIKELSKPIPKADEVLVKIHTTAINDYDWSMVTGTPRSYRLLFGLFKPKPLFHIPGMELSGTVVEVGEDVKTFVPGDEVYGDTSEFCFGTFAEFISVNEKALIKKPEMMSHQDAVAIPHASMLAVQGLIDVGEIKKAQNILINGAGGGVGTLGLQIAKEYNATVTGVDSGPKLEKMKDIGFDQVIDYKKEDFTRNGIKYDLVLDTKTTRSPSAYIRSLKPEGIYSTVGGKSGKLIRLVIANKLGKKNLRLVALKPNKDLDMINKLYLAGKLKPEIDGPYPFEDIPRLVQYFGEAKHAGKIVVNIES